MPGDAQGRELARGVGHDGILRLASPGCYTARCAPDRLPTAARYHRWVPHATAATGLTPALTEPRNLAERRPPGCSHHPRRRAAGPRGGTTRRHRREPSPRPYRPGRGRRADRAGHRRSRHRCHPPLGRQALHPGGARGVRCGGRPAAEPARARRDGRLAHRRGHARQTLQAVFRRANVSQSLLGCGAEGMPIDQQTSARLARDGGGTRTDPAHVLRLPRRQHPAQPVRRLAAEDYDRPEHPSQERSRAAVARAFDDPRQAPHGHRRLRPADLHLPARRHRARLPAAGRPSGCARRVACCARSGPHPHPGRHAGRARDGGRQRGSARYAPHASAHRTPGGEGGAEGLRGVGLLRGARGRGPRLPEWPYASRTAMASPGPAAL